MVHLALVWGGCPFRGFINQFQPYLSAGNLALDKALGAWVLEPYHPRLWNSRLSHMLLQPPPIVNHVAPLADLADLVV